MEKLKKNNGFIITCISCIILLLTLTYFGINSSVKGTRADAEDVESCTCPNGGTFWDTLGEGGTCRKTFDTTVEPSGWSCRVTTCGTGSSQHSCLYCSQPAVCVTVDSGDDGSTSTVTCNSKGYMDRANAITAAQRECGFNTDGSLTYDLISHSVVETGVNLECYTYACKGKSSSCTIQQTTCLAGQFLGTDNGCKVCKPCPSGMVCYGGTKQPQTCPTGETPNSNGTDCVSKSSSGSDSGNDSSSSSSGGSGEACWVCSGQYVWGNGTGCSYKATWKTQANCSGTVTSGGGGGTGGGNSNPSNNSNTGNGNTGTGGSTTDNTGNNTVGTGGNNNNNNNVNNNPQTGSIFIFVVWIIGFAAIGYSVYYFKSIKNHN